jgi:hypothetical protein
LESLIAERIEPVSILDILAYTQKWLHWDKAFGPLSGHDTKLDNPSKSNIYTTFCYGCGLGPTQSERSIKEVSRRHLSWINQRHVTEEKLNEANAAIINCGVQERVLLQMGQNGTFTNRTFFLNIIYATVVMVALAITMYLIHILPCSVILSHAVYMRGHIYWIFLKRIWI